MIPGVLLLGGVNTLPHLELPSFSVGLVLAVIWKASGGFPATSLSREASKNWALSSQISAAVRERRRCTSPCCWGYSTPYPLPSRWPASAGGSHSSESCETPTGMLVVLGFSRSLRLQALWAAPRYSPVMWQWSRSESPRRGLSHTWLVSAVRKASQSSRVILIAFGSASTP